MIRQAVHSTKFETMKYTDNEIDKLKNMDNNPQKLIDKLKYEFGN